MPRSVDGLYLCGAVRGDAVSEASVTYDAGEVQVDGAQITDEQRERLKKALDETAWYANAAATAMMLLSAQVVAMLEAVEKFAKLAQAVADEIRDNE